MEKDLERAANIVKEEIGGPFNPNLKALYFRCFTSVARQPDEK